MLASVQRHRWEIVDIGCADGSFVRSLIVRAGIAVDRYSGFEVDPVLRRRARSRIRERVGSARVRAYEGLERWVPGGDLPVLVIFWNVLPYLEGEAVRSVLECIERAREGAASQEAFVVISAWAEETDERTGRTEITDFARAKAGKPDAGRRWLQPDPEGRVRFGQVALRGRLRVLSGTEMMAAYGPGAVGPFFQRYVVGGWVCSPPIGER